MLKYIGVPLLLLLSYHSVATAQQPDDLKHACAIIAQQRNAALDALALAQAKLHVMTDKIKCTGRLVGRLRSRACDG